MSTEPEAYYSTASAARAVGVSLRTFQRLIANGEVRPHTRLPGKTGAWVFTRVEIDRLKAARRG